MQPRLPVPLLTAALLFSASVPGQDPATRFAALHAGRGPVGAARQDDGSIHAEGPTWQARFDAASARIEAEAGDAHLQIAALELRYLGARRGANWLPAVSEGDRDLGGREVWKAHGDTIERYLLRDDGVEQTFEFASQPPGNGDLVLEIAVGGNVWAPPSEQAAHQPLEFRFGDQRAIRYGEAFAFDRRGARVDVATRYDGQGRIELVVPGDFVAGATYPLTIDPIVGALLQPGGASFNDGEPDVAHDVETDRYLVVWRRTFASNQGIRGALYRGDGTVVQSLISLATDVGLFAPAVAFTRSLTENAFLVVWQQGNGISGRLVDAATGAMPAAAFAISSPGAGETDRRPSVSGPDGAMMVAWDRTLSGGSEPREIVLRDLYWLVPGNPNAITYGNEQVLQGVTSGNVSRVRLARSNVREQTGFETWYVNRAVWQRFWTSPAPGDHDIETASFRMKSGPLAFAIEQAPSLVPGASNIGPDEILPDIGSMASVYDDPTDLGYLIAWEDEGDVLAQRYDRDDWVGATFPIRATSAFEGAPAVGAGACEFTVAYLQIVPPAEFDVDVYAARVLPDGTVPQDHSLVDNPGTEFQTQVRASSRPIQTSSSDRRNVSLLAWMGQTGTAGTGLNDIRARFFEPVGTTSSFFGTACPGPLGELPAIGFAGGEPVPGNDDYAITLTNAPANSLAVLLIGGGLVSVPIPGAPGCSLYTDLPLIFVLGAITDGAGAAQVALPIPCSMPVDAPVAMQWGISTPGWNAFGWITSNDLDVNWID